MYISVSSMINLYSGAQRERTAKNLENISGDTFHARLPTPLLVMIRYKMPTEAVKSTIPEVLHLLVSRARQASR